jgi:hypothetical protein
VTGSEPKDRRRRRLLGNLDHRFERALGSRLRVAHRVSAVQRAGGCLVHTDDAHHIVLV